MNDSYRPSPNQPSFLIGVYAGVIAKQKATRRCSLVEDCVPSSRCGCRMLSSLESEHEGGMVFGVRELFRRIKKEAGRMPFLRIMDSRDRYLGRGKYERAVEIAARFPEIGWKLPPKRKAWESEHYRMSMFSAAALAMTYRSLRYGTVTSPPGGVMPKFTQRRR